MSKVGTIPPFTKYSDDAVIIDPRDWNVLMDFLETGILYLSNYESLDEALTSIGVTKVTLIINKTATLTGHTEIPDNISIIVANGYVFSGAYTLTIDGNFNAGLYPVISSSTTIVFNRYNSNILEVFPQWYGAIGDYDEDADTGTDNTTAINTMFASINLSDGDGIEFKHPTYEEIRYNTRNFKIIFPPGNYLCLAKIVMGSASKIMIGVELEMFNARIFSKEPSEYAFQIYEPVNSSFKNIKINGTAYAGLLLSDAKDCVFTDINIAVTGTVDKALFYMYGGIINTEFSNIKLGGEQGLSSAGHGWVYDYSVTGYMDCCYYTSSHAKSINISDVRQKAIWFSGINVGSLSDLYIKNIDDFSPDPGTHGGCAIKLENCKSTNISNVYIESVGETGEYAYSFDISACVDTNIRNVNNGNSEKYYIKLSNNSQTTLSEIKGLQIDLNTSTNYVLNIENCHSLHDDLSFLFKYPTETTIPEWDTDTQFLNKLFIKWGKCEEIPESVNTGSLPAEVNIDYSDTLLTDGGLEGNDGDMFDLGDDITLSATAPYEISPLGFPSIDCNFGALAGSDRFISFKIKTIENTCPLTLVHCWKRRDNADSIYGYYCGYSIAGDEDTDGIINQFSIPCGTWIINIAYIDNPNMNEIIKLLPQYGESINGKIIGFGGALLFKGRIAHLPFLKDGEIPT